MIYDKDRAERGDIAEKKFKQWLDKHNIPYLYIHQDIETFSSAFKNSSGKRPDFMVLIPNFGFIFVDVKDNYKCFFSFKNI